MDKIDLLSEQIERKALESMHGAQELHFSNQGLQAFQACMETAQLTNKYTRDAHKGQASCINP